MIKLYEDVWTDNPDDEEAANQAFMAAVRAGRYLNQQQVRDLTNATGREWTG